MFADRRSAPMFWIGSLFVIVGVLLHLPMFLMARQMHYMLAGMPMSKDMLWGMAYIIGGGAAAAYGLQPKAASLHVMRSHERIVAPEDAPLTLWHWAAGGALAMALIIDIMKPASLGFVTPGMQAEYMISPTTVAILPFSALLGTALGSFIWGALADLYGRRATLLLSAVMFIGTSICGAMPSFWWNVFMCFLMGLSAGGMLPVAYALLAEIMPTRHRGWSLVLVGGIGAVGGYLAASGLSALLQPIFGWRIMWFLNLPSGLILIALSPLIPESARFLMHIGRPEEARATLARFGSVVITESEDWDEEAKLDHSHLPPTDKRYLGTTVALTFAALSWGFVTFGLLLWLPGELMAEGRDMGMAATIIAQSSFIAVPVVVLAAFLYTQWSTKGALLVMIGLTALGLIAVMLRQSGLVVAANPVLPVTLLIIGSTGVISILLPYAAENYPLRIRGRATGWVAGCSKSGGLICQGLSALAAVPAIGTAAIAIAVPVLLGFGLIVLYGRETRGRDLRELER
ncbi:MAG: MFS transporter [Alphaproteobacteria bacterium]|nr:MFS transporter [Alphaproteobacteria bacterium]MDE2163969.1 MFS transporter [Alphaproteobacteria bacterium]MDE2267154.1 MFS transporter [Alphaproteobacteria bacterium]MDE2500083.1 MFS transporter [Alphaproteobacteria bacterium]